MSLDEWIEENPELWVEFMAEAGEELENWVSPGRDYNASKENRRDFAIYQTLKYAEEVGLLDLTDEEESANV